MDFCARTGPLITHWLKRRWQPYGGLMADATQGPRGTGSYPSNQRPGNFGGRITHIEVNNTLTKLRKGKKKTKVKK
jgi:hypothetical protein